MGFVDSCKMQDILLQRSVKDGCYQICRDCSQDLPVLDNRDCLDAIFQGYMGSFFILSIWRKRHHLLLHDSADLCFLRVTEHIPDGNNANKLFALVNDVYGVYYPEPIAFF